MSSHRLDGPDGVPVDHDDLGFSRRAIRTADFARAVAVAGVGIEAGATAVAT